MRNEIVNFYENSTNGFFIETSQYMGIGLLDLLRVSYVREYLTCLNELVSEVQGCLNLISNKCTSRRRNGIVEELPAISSQMSVFRDNINFNLQQLNSCLVGQAGITVVFHA